MLGLLLEEPDSVTLILGVGRNDEVDVVLCELVVDGEVLSD